MAVDGNYNQSLTSTTTGQENSSPSVSKDISPKDISTSKAKKLDASNNPIASHASTIFASTSHLPTISLKEHEFEAFKGGENSDPSYLDKTNALGETILSELNDKPGDPPIDHNIQVRQLEVEKSFREMIEPQNNKVSEKNIDELEKARGKLEKALENPDLTDEEMELIFAKLDDLGAELDGLLESKQSLSEVSKSINEATEKDKKSEQQIDKFERIGQLQSAAAIKGEKELELGDKYVRALIMTSTGYRLEKATEENKNAIMVHVNSETNDLKVYDHLKDTLNGLVCEYQNDDGEYETKNFNIKTFTKDETATFQQFIATNYPHSSQQHVNLHENEEKKIDDDHNSSSNSKSKQKTGANEELEAISEKKLNGTKLESVSVGPVNLTSAKELYFERLEKIEKEIKRLEEKIEKHEILVEEEKRENRSFDSEKLSIKSNEFRQDNLEIENQYKAFLNELPRLKQEIPLPTHKKIREVIINIHAIKKQVSSDIGGRNKEELIDNIVSLKKEVMTVTNEFLSTSGIQKTKGTNTQSKSEA